MARKQSLANRVNNLFIRSLDFSDLLLNFFVSAVVAILGIRIFLELTGYPQLGGGGLHIAHMLWGGALMLTAIILLLTFLGRSVKKPAAILAGLGFGTFIDELGKFITSDNNYFYKPAFSLIYLIFVLLYLLFYFFRKSWVFTAKEYLINSFEYLKEAVILDLDQEEKGLALRCLARADQNSFVTETMEQLFQRVEITAAREPNLYTKIKTRLSKLYFNLAGKRWFPWIIDGIFTIQALVSLLVIFASGVVLFAILADQKIELAEIAANNVSLLELFANALAGLFILVGIVKIWKSRLKAYCLFKRSVLLSIFLIQPFSFYTNQLGAFYGVLFDLFLLTALNYMITKETQANLISSLPVKES